MSIHDDLRAPTHDDLLAAANRHRCERCGNPGALYVHALRRVLCADCRRTYRGVHRELAEELEPGVWRQFDQVRPNKASKFGYLVILPETCQPVLAQFDEESKRFKVYCAQVGKYIQVPVTKWFAIPDPDR